MEYFKLNNGTQMPMAGIGVFTFTTLTRMRRPRAAPSGTAA